MRKVGYLRVSTKKQRHDRQFHILHRHCDELFVETASAATISRPVYEKIVGRLRAGDELWVLDLDRAYRNTRDALNEFHILSMRGIRMRIVNFAGDPNSEEGYYNFIVHCARAELERRLISRRTREGLAVARAEGKTLGRPLKLTEGQIENARLRLLAEESTVSALASEYRVGRWTLTRALRRPPSSAGSGGPAKAD